MRDHFAPANDNHAVHHGGRMAAYFDATWPILLARRAEAMRREMLKGHLWAARELRDLQGGPGRG